MLGLRVNVPVACFRKGFAREFWETEELPPPSTCYGFLLSLVGERDRRRHIGVRICPALVGQAERSTVLRTLWRVKDRKSPAGSGANARPDYQEILTGVRLAIWVDSHHESAPSPNMEERVIRALEHPEQIDRFGGLSLGESTHMVDEVVRIQDGESLEVRAYLLDPEGRGRLSLPVWVDHVGSAGTRFVSGNLEDVQFPSPPPERMPRIEPHG